MPAHQRYRAPAGNGEILAVPGFDAIPALVEENRRKLDRDDILIAGLPLRELRKQARQEILEQASGGRQPPDPDLPLLLAGHQPELSHPGVWVKNFALNGLARKLGGIPLNLIVDNDTVKSTSLRFPVFEDRDPASVHLESEAFDKVPPAEVIYAGTPVAEESLFGTFANRLSKRIREWAFEPLLRGAWETMLGLPAGADLGRNLSGIRARSEKEWGCANLELAVSKLCQTAAYTRFVWHLITDLPRFREVYNGAVRTYRQRHGIRSTSHPVPELKDEGAGMEAPFWYWDCRGRGRRLRLYIDLSKRDEGVRYRVKELEAWGLHPSSPFPGNREEFISYMSKYVPLLPRALTLTLFARVCLGDFFIHGIGGGKYDEVTDAIIRDYFGIDPPAYQVLSSTLHLPLPAFPATDADVKRLEHELRDLTWNPQRHLSPGALARPEVQRFVKEKGILAANEPPRGDHTARRDWFRRLQHATEQLRPLVAEQMAKTEADLRRARVEAHANSILQRRDYPWVLYPEETLRPFLQQFLHL